MGTVGTMTIKFDSKTDEVETLRRLAERAPADSYIASLLTEQLLKWFESRVRSDWTCDVFDGLARAEVDAHNARQTLQETKEALQRAADHLGRQLTGAMDEIARLQFALETSRKETEVWVNRSEERRQQAVAAEAKAKAKVLDDELVRLKAKLFDLIESREAAEEEEIEEVTQAELVGTAQVARLQEELEKVKAERGLWYQRFVAANRYSQSFDPEWVTEQGFEQGILAA